MGPRDHLVKAFLNVLLLLLLPILLYEKLRLYLCEELTSLLLLLPKSFFLLAYSFIFLAVLILLLFPLLL